MDTKKPTRPEDTRKPDPDEGSNLRKDPDDWTTGDESMTDAQRSYLHTLAEEAGRSRRST